MQTEQRFRELLEKYLAGTCSPTEKAMMEEWFEKGGNISKTGIELDDADRVQLLARIHSLQDKQASTDSTPRVNTLRSLFTGWRAAAVWTAILMTAGIATWRSGIMKPLFDSRETLVAYRIFQTGKAEVKQFFLPDSSEVTLNANTRLEYHPDFEQHRQIRLYGEALFSVAHDKIHPFTINTSDSLTTTVLGTRFNIQSYNKGPETRITVISGIVAVNRNKLALDTLTRSQAFRFQKASRSFTIAHDINTETVTGWTKGEWDYENLRFSELAILLQNHYGIALTSRRNTALLQTGVSVNFNSKQPARDILGVFCSFAGCRIREISPTLIELY